MCGICSCWYVAVCVCVSDSLVVCIMLTEDEGEGVWRDWRSSFLMDTRVVATSTSPLLLCVGLFASSSRCGLRARVRPRKYHSRAHISAVVAEAPIALPATVPELKLELEAESRVVMLKVAVGGDVFRVIVGSSNECVFDLELGTPPDAEFLVEC